MFILRHIVCIKSMCSQKIIVHNSGHLKWNPICCTLTNCMEIGGKCCKWHLYWTLRTLLLTQILTNYIKFCNAILEIIISVNSEFSILGNHHSRFKCGSWIEQLTSIHNRIVGKEKGTGAYNQFTRVIMVAVICMILYYLPIYSAKINWFI